MPDLFQVTGAPDEQYLEIPVPSSSPSGWEISQLQGTPFHVMCCLGDLACSQLANSQGTDA